MCGRFSNTLGPEEIGRQVAQRLGMRIEGSEGTRARNIAPTEDVLGIVSTRGGREARMLRWALLPDWAGDLKGRPQINARIETVRRAGKFIGVPADAAHRVLVIADEFIEWSKAERRGTSRPAPFGFSVEGGRAFCFAGLWSTNERVGDTPIDSCTIITCDARRNPLVAPLHDRMPAILADPEQWEAWLDPAVGVEDALSMCAPLGGERMSVRPLSQRYNDAREKDPEGAAGADADGGGAIAPGADERSGTRSAGAASARRPPAGEQLTLGG